MSEPVLAPLEERSRWSHWAMLCIVLALGVFSYFFGEKVPAGGGFGWDGVVYAKVVREFPQMVLQGDLNTYYAQRVLPAVIVRSVLELTGFDFRPLHIIRAFELYNLGILLGACFLWKKISDASSFSVPIRWMGFASVFLNFSVSKQNFFYPVLTDATALAVGLGLLYGYLTGRRVLMAAISVAGAFAWPTAAVTGALLLLLGRAPLVTPSVRLAQPGGWRLSSFRAYLLACLCCAMALLALRSEDVRVLEACAVGARMGFALVPWPGGFLNFADPCSAYRRLVTALPSILGLALLLRHLMGPMIERSNLARVRDGIRWSNVVLALGTMAAVFIGIRLISNPALANPSGMRLLLRLTLVPDTEGQLLMPLVSLISYYGPAVILMLCLWRRVTDAALGNGAGFAAAIAAGLMFSVVGEPRFITLIWPFLVFCLAQALQKRPPPRAVLVVFGVLVIALGQFWLPINIVPWNGDDYSGLSSFPKQLYFMHYGLWMAWPAYVCQAIAFACAFWWFMRALGQSDGSANSTTLP